MLKILQCVLVGDNYAITLERPDGTTVSVLIPIEGSNLAFDNALAVGVTPYGLNMMTAGHYE